MLLLLACTGDEPSPPVPDGGDPAEPVGGGEEPPPRTLESPGLVTLDCAETIPTDGKVDCAIAFAWPNGDAVWSGTAGVGLRGRSSAGFPKQQFAVELRDEAGDDAAVDLFGLGAEGDWVLNGMWIDRALFRNRLAWDLFRDLGEWAPRAEYVELTLNGAYWGVYLLTERIERDASRLDFEADQGAGSRWIVKADEVGFPSTLQYASWSLLEPADPVPAQSDGVEAELANIEALLLAGDPAVWDHVDLDSFVAFVLLEETVKNNDGYYLSHHLWRGDDGLVRFVPWDLDLTLGQPSYNDNELSDDWILYRPDLVALAAAQPRFANRMVERWTELRADAWTDDAILARQAGYRALIGDEAIDRNFAAWPIEAVDFSGYLYAVTSYEEELAHVRAWTTARLAWMDQQIADY